MKKILIIDDEALVGADTGKILEKHGYTTETAISGEQALKKLKRGRPLPDLILMDIEFGRGRMDGTEAARRINENYDIPVVFHSGHTDREIVEKTRMVTKYGFVQKVPGNTSYLVSTIDMALQLYETQRKYRDIFELAPDGIATIDLKGYITSVNTAFLTLTGFKKEEIVGIHMSKMPTLRKRDIPLYLAKFAMIISGTVPQPLHFKWKHKDGTEKTGEVRIGLLKENGKISGIQIIARDITSEISGKEALQKSLEEKEVLLKEIHHRLKNSLGILSSLINYHLRDEDNAAAFSILKGLQSRIQTISTIHEKLYLSDDLRTINFRTYAGELLEYIFNYSMAGTIKVKIDIPKTSFGIETALPLGLILNELATNALKYGFQTGRRNVFEVSLRKDRRNSSYILKVGNNGKPIPEDLDIHTTKTLGLHLVKILTEQLEGTLTLSRRNTPEFRIVIPLV